MTERSNLHVVAGHDGKKWLADDLVEGDYLPRVLQLLGGEPDKRRTLLGGISQAFHRGDRLVLVMTFDPRVDREKAKQIVSDIRGNREDTN